MQTVTGFSTGGYFNPEQGKYIVLKVTNNGASPVTCLAGREMTLGGSERFRSVDIEAGRTLTRAFLIADGIDDIHGTFVCGRQMLPVRWIHAIEQDTIAAGAVHRPAHIMNNETYHAKTLSRRGSPKEFFLMTCHRAGYNSGWRGSSPAPFSAFG